jgi:hypothetical protein
MQESSGPILRDGFEDAEGSYGTRTLHRGVWVTVDQPWDLIVGGMPSGELALIVVEIPPELFARYEWAEEDKGYREALIPAAELIGYPRWPGWECAECGKVDHEGSPGWRQLQAAIGDGVFFVCPDCAEDV